MPAPFQFRDEGIEDNSKYNLFTLALEFREEDPDKLAERMTHRRFVEWLVYFSVRAERANRE